VSIVTLVVAAAENGVIGRDNALPWHLPDDLKHFKQVTLGKPVVMGRKTFESIGKPLPGRQNIVVTHDANYQHPGVTVVRSPEAALTAAGAAPEIMVIGGAALFRDLLPRATRVHLTRVHSSVDGDVRWPGLELHEWRRVECEAHAADERHAFAMTFELWEKR
jgi:dihydrofolate reductase